MTRAFSRLADASPPESATRPHLASWYTPGLSDGLGDRLLMFDNTTASPLELLRFKPQFGGAPGFEEALRDRVEQLAAFEHQSLAKVRAVKWLGEQDGLTLVSNQVVGRRLSEILGEVQGTGLTLELIRQLTPVLAALHERGIAHGALTPDRIVITPDGRVILCEHVLGSALESLNMPCEWMRTELGIAVPPGNGRIALDGRSDIVQLGFIALSLAVGQRLDAAAYPDKVGHLVDQTVANSSLPPGLRRWLERALHLVWPPFASALEATASLDELSESRDRARSGPPALPAPARTSEIRLDPPSPPSNVVAMRPGSGKSRSDAKTGSETTFANLPPPSEPPTVVPVEAPVEPYFPDETVPQAVVPVEAPVGTFFPDETQMPPRAAQKVEAGELEHDARAKPPAVAFERQPEDRPKVSAPARTLFGIEQDKLDTLVRSTLREAESLPAQGRARPSLRPQNVYATRASGFSKIITARWFVAAVIAIALIEAVVIGGLLYSRSSTPGATQAAAGDPTSPPPSESTSAAAPTPVTTPSDRGNANAPARPSAPASSAASVSTVNQSPAPPQRTGTVKFASAVAFEVFEGTSRIGSTADPLSLPAGRHTLELVSEPLGYRATQTVIVVNGRTLLRNVTLPQGRMSINASPWALVAIDGKPVGETPLANVAVEIGAHEVTFRHPMLGESRQTAIVKVGGVTRVSANLQR